MTRKEKIALLEKFIATKKACDEKYEALIKLTGGDYQSPLADAIYKCIESGLDGICIALGDSRDGWISWFIYENQCGDNGFEAGLKGTGNRVIVPNEPITTVAQIIRLVEASGKRDKK